MNAFSYYLTAIFFLPLLTACATHPFEHESYRSFFANSTIQQALFKHRVFFSEAIRDITESKETKETQHDTLTIFIEGDGSPWYKEKYVKKDPSPSTLLLFEAMKAVKGDKLYLGRPCYFKTNDPQCHYRYWTSHRYGHEVIQSMRELLKPILENYQHIVFVGHSGGGTIATLLACDMSEKQLDSVALITLSANLDSDNWTDHHGWSRMRGSLNPSETLRECAGLTQYHYVGRQDTNVPYTLNSAYYQQHKLKPIIYDEASHSNWIDFWPDIVETNPHLD